MYPISEVAVADGTLYVPEAYSNTWTLAAYDADSGSKQWERDVASDVFTVSSVVVAANTAYLTVSYDEDVETTAVVHALDAGSGDERWSWSTTDGQNFGSLALQNDGISLSTGRTLHALGD